MQINGLVGISHGALDFIAFRLSLENYQNEFIRRVKMANEIYKLKIKLRKI